MDSTDLTHDGADAAAADHAAETADARRLAERYRLEFVDMDHFRIDGELFRSIPAELMLRYGFVPYRRVGKALVVVVSDPRDQPMFDELSALLSTPLKVAVGARSAIQSMLKKSESSQRVLEDATEGFEIQLLKEDDGGEDSLTVERLTSDISPIIRLVDSVIFSALQRRASDIHIETQDDAVHVNRSTACCSRRCGRCRNQFHSSIISRIKVMAELDIAERVRRTAVQAARARVKTASRHAERARRGRGQPHPRQRSISEQFTELRLDIWGSRARLRRFRKCITEPRHGARDQADQRRQDDDARGAFRDQSVEDKIVTIEGGQYQLKGLRRSDQREEGYGVRTWHGRSCGITQDHSRRIRDPRRRGSRSVHDRPSGVHDRPREQRRGCAGRFLNMGVSRQFVSALNCVLAQRLVRLICVHCKRPATITEAVLVESGLDPAMLANTRFFEGAGCIECGGTGYKGRTAVCELLDLTDRIRDLILDRRPTSEIKKAARDEGMRFLRDSAVEQVLLGRTTLREINKVTFVE